MQRLPINYLESAWSYDKLGRVTSQNVRQGASLSPVVRQDLQYFGNDDPHTMDHYLGSNHKQFEYGYDERHQLKTVNELTTTGYFSASYQYGAAGRFSDATETSSLPSGSDVKPRSVHYNYTGTDPEQVTSLTNIGTSGTFASYTYDDAGNQTVRCEGALTGSACSGSSIGYVYDGRDRLRRATKRNSAGTVLGSEEYWYDEAGQRNLVVKRDATGSKTEFLWFIEETEAHYDALGAALRVFGHVSMGTPVMRVDRSSDTAATVEYQFHGLANNTIAAVDQVSGMINASFSYAPFG